MAYVSQQAQFGWSPPMMQVNLGMPRQTAPPRAPAPEATAFEAGYEAGLRAAQGVQARMSARVIQPQPTRCLMPNVKAPSEASTRSGRTTPSGRSSVSRSASPEPSEEGDVCSKAPCHVFWCDHRAFKKNGVTMKSQLEVQAGVPVKTHKNAEKLIRLLRKKERAQGRPPCVFVVSWLNAQDLVSYLTETKHSDSHIILLCDQCGYRECGQAETFAASKQNITFVAFNFQDACDAVHKAVHQTLSHMPRFNVA